MHQSHLNAGKSALSFLSWRIQSVYLISHIITIIITPLEFFASALADVFLLEFEWQQVFPSLQNSPQYSGRSKQWCRLDGLHSSANFQVIQSL